MRIMALSDTLTVSGQVHAENIETLKDLGVRVLVCTRPDAESQDQPDFSEIALAGESGGMKILNLAFKSGKQTDEQIDAFANILHEATSAGVKVHAFCRTGNRAACLWAAAMVREGRPAADILAAAAAIGFDVSETVNSMTGDMNMTTETVDETSHAIPAYDVVIVGAGSGGIAVAASLLKRNAGLRIALLDPSTEHYYQPGWTMVGGGVFSAAQTRRNTQDLIPSKASWIKQAVIGFSPEDNTVQLDNGQSIHYEHLVVAPGLTLNWSGIKGLEEALGKNGVTSNYSVEHAPYTWELVRNLKQGRALFTQPPMPIKCAGAPQKALYLSADHWYRNGAIKNISVEFYNAGAVLFGVAAYVPALQSYIDKYGAKTHFNHTLVEVDGVNKLAYFKSSDPALAGELICEHFDMLHVCPPQKAPAFVAASVLADQAGWLDVDQFTLQHKRFANVWGLGDVMNTPNAKTMAAVRKQVPVVAENIISSLNQRALDAGYNGYGSCPLTVERGKIVLAEFGYGGKLLPTFPAFINDGTRPTWLAWMLKKSLLPFIYWHAMLKGREWLAEPEKLDSLKG